MVKTVMKAMSKLPLWNQASSFGVAFSLLEDQKELIIKTVAFFQNILGRHTYTHTHCSPFCITYSLFLTS